MLSQLASLSLATVYGILMACTVHKENHERPKCKVILITKYNEQFWLNVFWTKLLLWSIRFWFVHLARTSMVFQVTHQSRPLKILPLSICVGVPRTAMKRTLSISAIQAVHLRTSWSTYPHCSFTLAHFSNCSRWPHAAALEHVSLEKYWFALAHFSNSRWPFDVAFEHVSSFQGLWLALAHLRISRLPL